MCVMVGRGLKCVRPRTCGRLPRILLNDATTTVPAMGAPTLQTRPAPSTNHSKDPRVPGIPCDRTRAGVRSPRCLTPARHQHACAGCEAAGARTKITSPAAVATNEITSKWTSDSAVHDWVTLRTAIAMYLPEEATTRARCNTERTSMLSRQTTPTVHHERTADVHNESKRPQGQEHLASVLEWCTRRKAAARSRVRARDSMAWYGGAFTCTGSMSVS